jgi:ferredoxin
VDFENLTQVGSMMGSGGMIVLDERTCMVEFARYYISFLAEESCGKCVSCREGIRQMEKILTDICEGRGQESDLELLEDLGETIKEVSLCGLGKTAPNPVLSTLRYFRDEYLEHIQQKRCRAGVCKELSHYEIDKDACTGCGVCKAACSPQAISGALKELHTIDPSRCIACGSCIDVCNFNAVKVR